MLKKYFIRLFVLGCMGIVFVVLLQAYITQSTQGLIYSNRKELPPMYTALVLGSLVHKDGSLSGVVADRVNTALELYQQGKVKKLLISGDHGRKNYDEVNTMKNDLVKKGVPEKDIFLDHAGFDTYSSIVRAKEVFLADELIIVSQEFHLPRALYIANAKHVKAVGMVADKRTYGGGVYFKLREYMANTKAFFEILLNKSPRFLGKQIPITGDSKWSYD